MCAYGGSAAADDGFAEVARYYNLWRNLANSVGRGPYEEPAREDGRWYFRSDYWDKQKEWPQWAKFGDWAAWIVAPTPEGYFCVLRSLKHERASQRSEDIKVLFSLPVNAGKYIILQIGDSLRSYLRLQTLFVRWDNRGINPRLVVDPASPEVIDFLAKEKPNFDREFAERHLKRYMLKEDHSSYAFCLPSEQTNMEVLALSFEELTAALLEGMPESITSQVSRWRQ